MENEIKDIGQLVPLIFKDWQQLGSPSWDYDFLLDYRLRCTETIKDTPFIEGWTVELLRELAHNEIKGVDLILDKLIHRNNGKH